jgi:hypothetical protein
VAAWSAPVRVAISGIAIVALSSTLAGPAVAASRSTAETSAAKSARAACAFDTIAENPHRSGSDVSVHGYWLARSSGCAGVKAVVTTTLQSNAGSGWKTRAVTKKTLSSGGATASVARTACVTGAYINWRGVVDVDLIGLADDPFKQKSNVVSLPCK